LHRTHRSCGPLLASLLTLAALLPAAARAGAADPAIRVLLLETRDSVAVAGTRIRPAPGGLLAGGRPLGPIWRAPGPGPHAVGALQVRGSVEVQSTGSGLRVVNHVGLEDYVAGTLGREIYPGWELETLKAQAVATRTYALHRLGRRRSRAFDLGADTRDQVYGGADAETPRIRAAVAATRGELLAWRGAPILSAFHATSGGQTASAEEVWGRALPYLTSRAVPDEQDSPDTYWRAVVTGTTLRRALAPLGVRLGAVRQLRVIDRSASGRARRVRVVGTEGSAELSGRELRSALGPETIRSTLFDVHSKGGEFVFAGSGHGHGVGMSQWGAEAMAKRGATYREILAAFYPGATLTRGPLP
jgi:stage II sporulation protein D